MLYELSKTDSGKLREARKSAGLTQTELADRLGCTQSYVAKVENGRDGVNARFLTALCSELKLTAHIVEPQATIGD